MSTGHRIKIKGFKPDKSGRRIVVDPKKWDVATRLKKQGKTKVTYGRKR